MSAEPVRWSAEDPEGGAAQVGGHPVHVWWSRLRGAFRAVLLEPHRRAGGGTVGWRWRAPAHAPGATATDLVMLRRRLGGALLDFADELERADSGQGDLHATMHAVVEGLVRSSDIQLSAYVVLTEQGWMIRSWGFAKPSTAVPEDSDESVPEAVLPSEANVAPRQPTPAGRKRTGWAAGAVAAAALVLIAAWSLRNGRQAASSTTTEHIREVAEPGLSEKKSVKTTESTSPMPERSAETNRSTTGNMSVFPSIHGVPQASVAGGSFRGDLVAAAEPAAFTGVMLVSVDAKGDRAGPESHLGGAPDPEIAISRPEGAVVESDPLTKSVRKKSDAKTPPRDASTEEERTDAEKNDAGFNAAANGVSSPAHAAPPGKPPADADESDVEARKHLSKDVRVAPEAGQASSRPESLYADTDESDLSGAKNRGRSVPTVSKRSDLNRTIITDAVKPGSTASAELRVIARMSAGAWRVVRVRDVMLETWPAERQANGDALKLARKQALAAARAEIPVSFRTPVVRLGWRLRLAPATWLSAPPVWRDATTGRSLAELESGRSPEWTAVEIINGMDARLVAADGREYARVIAGKDGSSASVHGTPEVQAVVPWVGVDTAAGETKASRWIWRSLSAVWSDASWETIHDGRGVSVRWPPESEGNKGGMLALVDDAGGWALACMWSAEFVSGGSVAVAKHR